MSPADDLQCFLVHGLGIDGNPGDGVLFDDFQFFPGNAVRTARFHGKLLHLAEIKMPLDLCQQPVQLLRFQGRRGSAADVDRIQLPFLINLRPVGNLLAESIQIIVHLLFPDGKGAGAEGTVEADTGTERDPHIEAVAVVIIDISQNMPFPVGN